MIEMQQLQCPVCMCLFSSPVTAYCGHTFCKQCLIGSTKSKHICPMCRKQINHQPDKMSLDLQVYNISQKLKTYKSRVQRYNYFKEKARKNTQQCINNTNMKTHPNHSQIQTPYNRSQQLHILPKMTEMLLVDVRSQQPLFPYNKGHITFQLQSPNLKNKLDNFIIRQQQPYRKYGLIGSINSLEYLRHNVYSCIILIKAFCKIEDQWVQNAEQGGQQYFYRCCDVCEIAQDMSQISIIRDNSLKLTKSNSLKMKQENQKDANYHISNNTSKKYRLNQNDNQQGEPMQILWEKFYFIFKKIDNKRILKEVFNKVDKKNLTCKNDLVAVYYTILGILNIPSYEKYKVAISFNTQKRVQQIDNFLKSFFNVQNGDYQIKKIRQNWNQKRQNNNLKLIRKFDQLINIKGRFKGMQIQFLVILIIIALWFILGDGSNNFPNKLL